MSQVEMQASAQHADIIHAAVDSNDLSLSSSPLAHKKSFSSKYFIPLSLTQFSYLFGLTTLHAIGWFHYLLDEHMDLEWVSSGLFIYTHHIFNELCL